MAFETPRLDDRAFGDIVEEARQRIALYAPEWTDHNISDPGITLLELFAWMTDIVLYRLNRVPDKNYVKFMELIGMRLRESEAAQVPVTFWLTAPQPVTVTIPAGTEVATTRTDSDESIVFSVDAPMDILVPELNYIFTSEGQAVDGRSFKRHNVNSLEAGTSTVKLFASEPPQANDAIYFGFEQDLSHHILGFEMVVQAAEGAGVDPKNPPYVFEVLGDEQNWITVDIDMDETLGLNRSGLIRILLPKLRRAVRGDQAAYWVRLRLIESEEQKLYGVTPEVEQLTIASWGGTAEATNVNRHFNELLGRADGTMSQRFFLSHTPVVARAAPERILIQKPDGTEEEWQEVSDFSNSSETDKHYTINSQTGEIRFGLAMPQRDGQVKKYGDIPEKSSYVTMLAYRSGGGTAGNVASKGVNILKTGIPYIERVSNLKSAVGGLDAENLEAAKIRVPSYLRSLHRAVTAGDYEYLTMEAARGRVGRVHCLQPPQTNRGEVKVLVIPSVPRLSGFIAPESLVMPDNIKQEISHYLDERRLISTQLDVMEPSYQWVETQVRFHPGRGHDPDVVKQRIEERLFDFLNPITGGMDGNGWAFGRDLYSSDVMAILLAVPGVEFIRAVRLFPVMYTNGIFNTESEVQTIPLVAHGVIASYRHTANPS
ncbi:MAG: putative baseplate assembly protein [Anaerolineae bacterium]|nr:putative baseplate assembly protein [Anaerolineae bacterium]